MRRTTNRTNQFPHQSHLSHTTVWMMNLTVLIYLCYGVVSLGLGIYYTSWWFIALAGYYLAIWFMEASIVRNITRRQNRRTELEYRRMHKIGAAILIMDAVLIVVVLLGIILGRTVKYPGIAIHITAIYDIVIVILAAYRLFHHMGDDSPVIVSSKCLNLTLAMTAILSLAAAGATRFLGELILRRIVIGVVGIAVCGLNYAIGRYLIRLADRDGAAKAAK